MPETLKIHNFDGSLGLILPKAIADRLALQEGDELYVSVNEDGVMLTPYDPAFDDALEDARAFMRTHRDAFRELAK